MTPSLGQRNILPSGLLGYYKNVNLRTSQTEETHRAGYGEGAGSSCALLASTLLNFLPVFNPNCPFWFLQKLPFIGTTD